MSRAKIPRITQLRVRNFRALKNIEIKELTPLTAFLGPNGAGKSTLFDVFAFLSECFTDGLRRAWDRRNRFRELRTRGSDGPIVIELKYREAPKVPLITYHLAIDEDAKGPFVSEEWMQWKRKRYGAPFQFLKFQNGEGEAVSGREPDEKDRRARTKLSSRELLAVNSLGQFAEHPRVSALRDFITGWYVSYLTADNTRGIPEAGPQERLTKLGDNLPNVIQYLKEQHEGQLDHILEVLRRRIPRLDRVNAELMQDGRLLLQVKDAPFERPVLAKYASDGTLKMLAYLTLLYDPTPPTFIGIEEPENHLHPRLLPELTEECRNASSRAQVLIATHSPFVINAMHPNEVRVLYRDESGYTQTRRVSDMAEIVDMVAAGAHLGELWMEGHFDVGDPLTRAGGPKRPTRARGRGRK